jgi:hypothetical protein
MAAMPYQHWPMNHRVDNTCVAVAPCFAPACCPPAAVRQVLKISSSNPHNTSSQPSSPWCLPLTSNRHMLPVVSHPEGSSHRAPHRVRRESTLQAQPDSRIGSCSSGPEPCRRSVVGPGFQCDILAELGKATGDLQQQQQQQRQEDKEGAGVGASLL